MIFEKAHKHNLYNTLLVLSRNIFFYKKIKLSDKFETRIYLMFVHFSIMMIIFKIQGQKFNQKIYDEFFFNIENNLREIGFGDVAVNQKMKNLNKILYDILLKLRKNSQKKFEINEELIFNYFVEFNYKKTPEYIQFENYFDDFYNFCFKLPLNNMVRDVIKFNYGSS